QGLGADPEMLAPAGAVANRIFESDEWLAGAHHRFEAIERRQLLGIAGGRGDFAPRLADRSRGDRGAPDARAGDEGETQVAIVLPQPVCGHLRIVAEATLAHACPLEHTCGEIGEISDSTAGQSDHARHRTRRRTRRATIRDRLDRPRASAGDERAPRGYRAV